MILAVDFSSWTAVPTAEQVQCLKDMGVERAFIGTRGNRLHFRAQAQAFLDAGVPVDAYLYLYWSEPGATQAVNCLNIIGDGDPHGVPVGAVWLDVEFDGQNPWPGLAGVNSVLYSAYERLGAAGGRAVHVAVDVGAVGAGAAVRVEAAVGRGPAL